MTDSVPKRKRFRVALSFPGERREYVQQVADLLAARFTEEHILYDRYHTAEFANADLAFHLPDLYRDESDLIVAVLCEDYEKKEWCGLEWRAIFSLIKEGRSKDVMLLRADDAPIRGLYGLDGSVLTEAYSPTDTFRLILQRLAVNEGQPRDAYLSADVDSKTPTRNAWFLAHPYPMPPHFTGRITERQTLTDWLASNSAPPLFVLRALGGYGKSALVWHWLMNDVDPMRCPRVVWWSFYEGDASLDAFLSETLDYLSGGSTRPVNPTVNDVTALLHLLQQSGTLLVLDGFERALRAFGGMNAAYQGDMEGRGESPEDGSDRDCISPLAERFLLLAATLPAIKSKILVTTRLCPRILEAKGGGLLQGCREEELLHMQPADAVAFFQAKGIRGTRAEIEAACEPYGYHPLSLTLLAGLIAKGFQQPGDIAVAHRVDVSGDLIQRRNHVLQTAYDSLTPQRQKLLSHIACFRGPVKYEGLKAVAEMSLTTETRAHGEKNSEPADATSRNAGASIDLDTDLRDLIDRGLLHHDTNESRFDLHPIVRRYTYDRLAAPDRAAAHTGLRDYFDAVPMPEKVTCVDDLAPVIELYHHSVRAGLFDDACDLYYARLANVLFFQLGAYQLITELLLALFPDGEGYPPRLKKESDQAWALNELSRSCSLNGQPRRSLTLKIRATAIERRQSERGSSNLAIGLLNLAKNQWQIGCLQDAQESLRNSIELNTQTGFELRKTHGQNDLGLVLSFCGKQSESETELAAAIKLYEQERFVQGQAIHWGYLAIRELIQLRCTESRANCCAQNVVEYALRAQHFAIEDARTDYPVECDFVRVHWLLGAAYRVVGQLNDAERHLNKALERCRRINLVEFEADILIDLARLRIDTGKPEQAQRLAEEALMITERCEYVLQGADAHLVLAELAVKRNDKALAREHAVKARDLAYCDGPPDYTYKAAYTEALALLEKLGDGESSGGN